ncbi:hypothetical protein KC357_g296 [Hortaea werneckii]|nr:hypothetical protein KC357_g296 [Hortaea werneckii]
MEIEGGTLDRRQRLSVTITLLLESALPYSGRRCFNAANWTMSFRPLFPAFEQRSLLPLRDLPLYYCNITHPSSIAPQPRHSV